MQQASLHVKRIVSLAEGQSIEITWITSSSPPHYFNLSNSYVELTSIGVLKMEIKVVELNPMKVASFQYVGENPELNAFKEMITWAQEKNLLSKNMRYHFFGFNNPIPTEDNPVYGYEVWLPLDDDFEGDGEIKIKEFKGGLFAVTEMLFSDFLSGQDWNVFHSAAKLWMKENMYEFDSTVQWLEEHITEKKEIENFIQKNDLPKWNIGLYLPIRKIG